MPGFSVGRAGNWAAARQKFKSAEKDPKKRLALALRRAALILEREMKLGLQNGAPGGNPLKPLSPFTVFLRRSGSSSPLLDNGDLLGSIRSEVNEADLSGFVGVYRNAAGPGELDRARLAEIHEFGVDPYAIEVTPAMRRFFLAISIQSGGRFSPLRADTTILYHPGIPARPFIRPALEVSRAKIAKQIRLTVGEG